RRRPRTVSIATSDSRWGSFRFFLFPQLAECSLRLLYVVECEFARFDQVRHHRLRASAEESEQVVDETALRGIPRDHGFEYVGITDLFYAAHRLFRLQAIDGGLYGRISRPVLFRKSFLNLPDGAGSEVPEGIHDLKFELAQSR